MLKGTCLLAIMYFIVIEGFPTCSAPPGWEFCHLVPSLLLKVITLNTADSLWSLASNHNHHLDRRVTSVAQGAQVTADHMCFIYLIGVGPNSSGCVNTFGQQAGVLMRVRAVFIRALWSAGNRWYFMASIR